MTKLLHSLRGFLAICLVAIVCAVAFSPGDAYAPDKAVAHAMQAHDLSIAILDMNPTPAGPVHGARSPGVAGAERIAVVLRSVVAQRDGYMNWRMRDTTRNV